jgi:RND superfamily putative drug exporter
VIFAGVVVAISFLGLAFMGIPFVTAMGATGAIVVFLAVLVAITLMPALLGFAGARVDQLKVPFLHSSEGIDPASFWFRFSRSIQRRPLPYLVVALVVILTLASPVLDIRLGFTDDGNRSTASRARRAYDLLAEGFGPGFNGPVLIVVDGPAAPEVAARVAEAAAGVSNVDRVLPPRVSESGTTAAITLFPGTAPQDEATKHLVDELRTGVAPSVATTDTRVLVGGAVAAFEDIGDQIAGRLPFLFAGVIGISFLLLMAVFRSVLVALKAAILNLLSISCSFGVLVAVFQWGWFGDIIGVSEGPIETFAPMMLFAILFGLSMDYEVFLISRIREEYVRTGDNATAVANGLTATARVITAAAAIMVSVFLSFVFGDQRVIKEFGLGLATAIFVDATIVRLVLVPATMELLGDANWWLPRWLDRLLPHFNLEGTSAQPSVEPSPAGSPAAGGR